MFNPLYAEAFSADYEELQELKKELAKEEGEEEKEGG